MTRNLALLNQWYARPLLVCCLVAAWVATSSATNVVMKTSLGDIELSLFDEVAPITVDNFAHYVESGAYDDTIVHRSVPGFVIQGGGFATDFNNIATVAPIVNEFNAPNMRGTIAMAKAAGNPDSATSQWFINLVDNSVPLDSSNGGYTVFGEVVSGMDVVDQIASLQQVDLRSLTSNAALATTPLVDEQAADLLAASNLVVVQEAFVRVATTPEPALSISWLALAGVPLLRLRRRRK